MKNLLEGHVAVVAIYNLSLRLEFTDYPANLLEILGTDLRSLVKKHYITELNLLDHKAFDIFFADTGFGEVASGVEFITHAKGIYDCNDTVKPCISVFDELRPHLGNRTNSLRNRLGLADTTGLNHDIVETVHRRNLADLLN